MGHLAELHRAILIDPADDLGRLAYADACEEVGQDDMAEFVRLQVALTHPTVANIAIGASRWIRDTRKRINDLTTNRDPAKQHILSNLWDEPFGYTFDNRLTCEAVPVFSVARGFPCCVCCTMAWFHRNAKALFQRHPIKSVVLADRKPNGYTHNSAVASVAGQWWSRAVHDTAIAPVDDEETDDHEWWLTQGVFDALVVSEFHYSLDIDVWGTPPKNKHYGTDRECLVALSEGAVAWGRSLNGLPMLPSLFTAGLVAAQ